MIRLRDESADRWIECPHGVRLLVRPATAPMMRAANVVAHAIAREAVARLKERHSEIVEEEERQIYESYVLYHVALELGHQCILDWEGVGDEEGNPLPVTPKAIEQLLSVQPILIAFAEGVMRAVRLVDEEGNG